MADSTKIPIPLGLRTLDLLRVQPPGATASSGERMLATVYGLMQIVVSGVPQLRHTGRVEAIAASFLRDATISTAGCLVTARQGLYEPTMRLGRGVLEARLFIAHIRTAPDPQHVANLFAVERILARKRNLEDQVSAGLRKPNDSFVMSHLRDIERAMADSEFQKAGSELKALRQDHRWWHGYRNLRQLAEALEDASAYHLVYAPASAFFVHPGDPDVHLMPRGDEVELQPLRCDDPDKLDTAQTSIAHEAYRVLAHVATNWTLGDELRVAIDQLVPLMLIAAAHPELSGPDIDQLEEQSGIPRAMWRDLVSVTFDWDPSEAQGHEAQPES